MQASIFLAPALFSQFDVPWASKSTGVRLHPLADALLVFASAAGGGGGGSAHAAPLAELILRSPGAGGGAALELASTEGGTAGRPASAVAALVDGLDPPSSRDLTEGWAGSAAALVAPAALLREAVEDLEWGAAAGSGVARLTLAQGSSGGEGGHGTTHPPGPRATLSAGPGPSGEFVSVDLPIPSCEAFELTGGSAPVSFPYRYRLLRAALGAGAGKGALGGLGGEATSAGGGVTTRLAIDGRGVLKVTHLVPVEGSGQGAAGGAGGGGGAGRAAATAVVQFVVLPALEDEEEGGGDDPYRGPRSGAAA